MTNECKGCYARDEIIQKLSERIDELERLQTDLVYEIIDENILELA